MLQQEFCAIDDVGDCGDLGIWLFRDERRFEPGIYLGCHGAIIFFSRCRKLSAEVGWDSQIELRVILRHGELMTQKFTARYAPPTYHLCVKHLWLVASKRNDSKLAFDDANGGKLKTK
nr:hypothetical protein [Rhizobium laguerreae]